MYKLVIADDEDTIRRGICSFIDWKSMGFEVAADFDDGKETIEYADENPVDVILADIRMIEVSGLEVAKYMQEHHPEIMVVILSSYREFDYAQKAVEYDVKSYLTKPIDMDEVQKVFTGLKNKLDARAEEQKQKEEGSREFELMIPELQNQFLASLLMGISFPREDMAKRIRALHLGFDPDHPYAVIDIRIDDTDSDQLHADTLSRGNLIRNLFENDDHFLFAVVSLSSEQHKVIASSVREETKEDFKSALEGRIRKNIDGIYQLLAVRILASIETVYPDIYGFEERKYALTLKGNPKEREEQEGQKGPDGSSSVEGELSPEEYENVLQKYRLLMDIIDSGDFDRIEGVLDNIFFGYRNLSLEQLKHLMLNMFMMLSNKYRKMGGTEWELITRKLSEKKVYDISNKGQFMQACRAILNEAVDSYRGHQSDTAKTAVQQSVEYMKKHFAEPISLSSVAEMYYLNASYFSRIFKEYTGETFTDRLIRIRMEEAMRLLSEGQLRVFEIAEKVGYMSKKYFNRIFKNYTGMSPSEYQRSLGLKKNEDL